ncbi:MAG TPA: DegV family protein, partial [Firmicutes bacterium]|nr:DegV family protein [Candidatus Fermentithermobacillaceae bacterium]
MNKVKVVTDSASGLPKDIEKEYEITVVPIPIQVGEQSYKENVDLSAEKFY